MKGNLTADIDIETIIAEVYSGLKVYSIEYSYTPGTPDVPYLRNGDPGYPGDPDEIDIIKVFYMEKELTTEEQQEILDTEKGKVSIIDALYEYVNNNWDDFVPDNYGDDDDYDDREEYDD